MYCVLDMKRNKKKMAGLMECLAPTGQGSEQDRAKLFLLHNSSS